MKQLFDRLSNNISRITTQTYSTSFSMGIYFLDHRLRSPVYAIYGFVRLADEIVDSFHGYDKRSLLAGLRQDAEKAIENRISVNPILNSFQEAVHEYQIGWDLIDTFLLSMEQDLDHQCYNEEKYKQYILGSAEVVGLMCLHVFTEGNKLLYEDLKPYAMRLGAAFQKVNFLRDMKDDFHELGRTYFPNVDMTQFTADAKKQIEEEIDGDFSVALSGIRKLPPSSKGGVYLAYVYYRSLFKKIKKLPPQHILKQRIRINNGRKLGLMVNSLLECKMRLV